MFYVTESRSSLIQCGKEQTISELYINKIVLRAKRKYPDKKYDIKFLFRLKLDSHLLRRGKTSTAAVALNVSIQETMR